MTESAKSFNNFDNNVCKSGDSTASSLGGELMLCKSPQDIFRPKNASADMSFLPSGQELLAQFDAPHGPRCEAPTHEKRGPVEVTIDEYGEMFEVKDTHGNTYTKNADGKWTQHFEVGDYKSNDTVENVKVDCKGNLTFDYNDNDRNVHVKYEYDADGSTHYTNEFGRFSYDKDHQLVEAPAGEGYVRKFHYTNGQLDQIDGRLGHWDRVDQNGEVSWVNRDSGAVWAGDFEIRGGDMLDFKGRNGAHWRFTPWGTDVNKAGEKE